MADFDTLKYCHRLEESGVAPEHAVGHTAALADALAASLGPLATKADLKDTEARLKADLMALTADLRATEARLKADMIAHTDKKVGEIQRGQRWAIVIFLTVAVPVVGGLFSMIYGLYERIDGLDRPPVEVREEAAAPPGAALEGARSVEAGPEAPDAGVDVSMAPTPRALEGAALEGARSVEAGPEAPDAGGDVSMAPTPRALEDAATVPETGAGQGSGAGAGAATVQGAEAAADADLAAGAAPEGGN